MNTTLKFESSSMEFKTNLGQSYRCTREESLPLSFNASNKTDAVLVLQKVRLQAFHKDFPAVFGEGNLWILFICVYKWQTSIWFINDICLSILAQDCELDTPDIVPIAVGCALAALVFIVLIAYLVGRHRSQARGYLSMWVLSSSFVDRLVVRSGQPMCLHRMFPFLLCVPSSWGVWCVQRGTGLLFSVWQESVLSFMNWRTGYTYFLLWFLYFSSCTTMLIVNSFLFIRTELAVVHM